MTSLPKSTAFYAPDYGFTRMTINNKTHITIQQISVEKVLLEKKISQSFWIQIFGQFFKNQCLNIQHL